MNDNQKIDYLLFLREYKVSHSQQQTKTATKKANEVWRELRNKTNAPRHGKTTCKEFPDSFHIAAKKQILEWKFNMKNKEKAAQKKFMNL